jgi:hypothetical protein
MTTRTPIKRTPVTGAKQPTNKADRGKLRPVKGEDGRVQHGVWSLDKLLKSDIDKRLTIARERDRLEADLIDQVGGRDNLTPSLILLIKRITHKALVLSQMEKMGLLGQYDLTDKRYVCLSNSFRLDLAAFEAMLRQRKPKVTKTLDDYISSTYGASDK